MKLFKTLVIALLVLAGFFWIKAHQPSMQAVYPEQCWFLIDEQFSSQFQKQIREFVTSKYQSCKNLDHILQDVSTNFAEINAMDAYICKIDKMCFTFDGARPLFVLNDCVVDSNLHLIRKESYRDDIIQDLHALTATNVLSLQDMMHFMNQVPVSVFNDFDIRWNTGAEIILQAKSKQQEKLFFSMQNMPTENDIALFKELQKKLGIKRKKSNNFDFRFNNQVIVR